MDIALLYLKASLVRLKAYNLWLLIVYPLFLADYNFVINGRNILYFKYSRKGLREDYFDHPYKPDYLIKLIINRLGSSS